MIENIIFYGICVFFSLIALGAIWPRRYERTKLLLSFVLGVPAGLAVLIIAGYDALSVLDIRELFRYMGLDHNQLYGRARALLVGLLVMGIVAYFTAIECLLIQANRQIRGEGRVSA
jgi:hypothetical protein